MPGISFFTMAKGLCRLACLACMAVILLPASAGAAAADPPFQEIWKVGDITVTAIQDLPGAMGIDIFKGPASEAEKGKYFTDGKAEAGYNVFLMRAGGKNVLFDTGNGGIQKTPGRLIDILSSLGVAPEAVDLVLLTHLHMDHIGGLMKGTERAFPRAKIAIAKPEKDFWLQLAATDPSNANAALVKVMAAAYGDDVLPPFAFGDTVLPGVTALNAVGHTPGHTVFQVDAEGKSLLIVGDLIHGTPLQFALPDECAVYDMDMPTAVESRRRILTLAAEKNIPIAGMHLPFSGDGMVKKDGPGYSLER